MILALAVAYVLLVICGAWIYRKAMEECRRRAIRAKRPKNYAERTENEWDMIERLRRFNTTGK